MVRRFSALVVVPVAAVLLGPGARGASAQVTVRTQTRVEHSLSAPMLTMFNRELVSYPSKIDFRESATAAAVSLDGSNTAEIIADDAFSRTSVASTAFASAGLLRLGMEGAVEQKITPTRRGGTALMSGQQVKVRWRDTYLVMGNTAQPQPGRPVLINAFLNVSGSIDAQAQIEHSSHSESSASAEIRLILAGRNEFGQAIVPGPAGGSLIAMRTASTGPNDVQTNIPAPGVIPVTLLAFEGVPSQMIFELTLLANARADNSFNAPRPSVASASFDADFTHTLSWGGITSVTDANTGQPISGWSITAESGADYAQAIPEPTTGVPLLLLLLSLTGRRRPR
jgi:hypothetical protein